mgnify:FL=1
MILIKFRIKSIVRKTSGLATSLVLSWRRRRRRVPLGDCELLPLKKNYYNEVPTRTLKKAWLLQTWTISTTVWLGSVTTT